MLTDRQFADAFPFSFVVDADLQLVSWGRSFHKLFPEAVMGRGLADFLRMIRPTLDSRYEAWREACGDLCLMEGVTREVKFRGQLFPRDSQGREQLLFLGGIWLNEPREMESLGLQIQDFSPHDPTLDVSLLVQSHAMALADAKRLAARLHTQRKELKEANAALSSEIEVRSKAEKELIAAKNLAEASARAKSEFLAVMSHEIRTPLNGILGFADLLGEMNLEPEQRQFVEIIQHSGHSLLTIINDILDFSKIEAGRMEFEQATFDLQQVAEEVAQLLFSQAEKKSIEMLVKWDPVCPTEWVGDLGRVRQCLLNLVSNAVKFTSQGHVMIDVFPEVIPGSTAPQRVVCAVRDTGIGIPASKLSLLFQEFSQVDASTTRKYGGTGLGLAITRRLIQLMGGETRVESEEGRGSTFSMILPVMVGRTEELAAISSRAASVPPADWQGVRVLVVDDRAVSREMIRAQLERWKFEVGESSTVNGALTGLRGAVKEGRRYGMVIFNATLHGASGLDLARAIRADADLAGLILVIVGTTHQLSEEAGVVSSLVDGRYCKPLMKSEQFYGVVRGAWEARAEALMGTKAVISEPSRVTAPVLVTEMLSDAKGEGLALRPEGGGVKRRRALVVEDNLTNQMLVRRLLERKGYQVDVAENGRHAIARTRAETYDLIFMDCQMPEMDGFAATRCIRAHAAQLNLPRVPVIALTANVLMEDREKCTAAGMDDYISKPMTHQDLERVLDQWGGERGI